jgi:hypothetical protein
MSSSNARQVMHGTHAGQRRPAPMRERIVHVTAEQLLEVVEDLCMYGGGLLLSGRRYRGETLIEQAAELLAHRAQVLSTSRTGNRSGRSLVDVSAADFIWVSRWTN